MKQRSVWGMSVVCLVLVLTCTGCPPKRPPDPPVPLSYIELKPDDRIMVLAPHPDDEVIACGGIIQQAKAAGLPVKVVFLTYGDNNEWSFILYRKRPVLTPRGARSMGRVRRREAFHAGKELGLERSDVVFLGYPDFRTLDIWKKHWFEEGPALSYLTHSREVPYDTAFRPGAAYKGDDILFDVTAQIKEFKPTKLFVSSPADQNPDHVSLYLFTKIALWDLEGIVDAQVYPYLTHYGYWPTPEKYLPEESLNPPVELGTFLNWYGTELSPDLVDNKLDAIKEHKSQYRASKKYLQSFMRTNELFADFPALVLCESAPASVLAEERAPVYQQLPAELTEEEREEFCAVDNQSAALINNNLVYMIKLTKPLGKKVDLSLYAYGYRSDVEFRRMPKLEIKVGPGMRTVLDQKTELVFHDVDVVCTNEIIQISVPLDLMRNPERIVTGISTYRKATPLDWVSWRTLLIPRSPFGWL